MDRICNKCKKTKDVSEFFKRRSNSDSYETICKYCRKQEVIDRTEKYKKMRLAEPNYIQSKICNHCKIEKDISQFYYNKRLKDGYSSWCKECKAESDRKNTLRVKNTIKDPIEFKTCTRCKEKKTTKEFYRSDCDLSGYMSRCKECVKITSFKRSYGVELEHKNNLIKGQDYKCLSCGDDLRLLSSEKIHLDHNHKTGEIRGVLCMDCNWALGLLKEDPDSIYNLHLYAKNICGK